MIWWKKQDDKNYHEGYCILLLIFFPISAKGDNFCVFICFTAIHASSEKESTLKDKNLLPMGANSFLLE